VKPVIGLCTAMERARWGVWDDEAVLLPRAYVSQVTAAGGIPVLLAPDPAITAEPDAVLGLVDGLVLAGGADVDPSAYGAEPDPRTLGTVPERDAFELALMRRAFELDLPVLGVCRGMQVMAVEAGGVLDQHLPDVVGHDAHYPLPGEYTSHHATPVAGTRLATLLGTEALAVPTYHHQAVQPESLADTAYRPSAWHADGTLEAMEDPTSGFRLAVQWHPEAGDDGRLFDALVAAAADRRASDVRSPVVGIDGAG
jgi:putative glutamine amidotransferase